MITLWRLENFFHINLTIFSIHTEEVLAEMLTKLFLRNLKLIHDKVIFSPRGHVGNIITMKKNVEWKKILEKSLKKIQTVCCIIY